MRENCLTFEPASLARLDRMALKFTTSYIEDALAIFRQYKQLGERAMAQVTDEQLFATLDEEANSIAIIVKHMTGNMRSRWTDFLTSDGEKSDAESRWRVCGSARDARGADAGVGAGMGLRLLCD